MLERAEPHETAVEVLFAGADHGSYILNPVLKDITAADLSFERSLTLVHAADPSAEILIVYVTIGSLTVANRWVSALFGKPGVRGWLNSKLPHRRCARGRSR